MKTANLTGDRIKQYLAEGKRFDGRGLDEFRDIVIETGVVKNGDGSARVLKYYYSSFRFFGS